MGVVVIAVLYFARAVLVPFALAMLFSFILTPFVKRLEALRLPRVPSVLLVVILAMASAGYIGLVGTTQLVDVTAQLPNYSANIKKKVATLHGSDRIGLVKATNAVNEIGKEVIAPPPATAPTVRQRDGLGGPASKSHDPVEVAVVKSPGSTWSELLVNLGPLGVAGIVLVFTVFILLRTEDLRNRFIRLVGHDHLNVMTQALDDASRRISKYLFLQFIVNVCYGIVLGIGLHFIGLPNAILWGALASVLRFLPYIGAPIAALFPIILSLAIFDGWTHFVAVVGLYLVIEIVVANFVEPFLYGANTGISALAILVAAVFWTLLWGPIGLVLSTPLTVCLVVVGRHVPELEFLHVLLGDEPVLTPEKHFYQRLLASDLTEARQVLEQHLEGRSLVELYDSVVIPALGMARRDLRQNDLDEAAGCSICQSARELVEELNEEYTSPVELESRVHDHTLGRMAGARIRIICIPSRDINDETAAIMLVQLLEREGEQAQCIALGTTPTMLDCTEAERPDVVVISALQPFALSQARKLHAQMRARLPRTKIIVGLWNFSGDVDAVSARLVPEARGMVVTSLAAAVERLGSLEDTRPGAVESDAVVSR